MFIKAIFILLSIFQFSHLCGESIRIGWYSDSDAEYLKMATGVLPNKYGFIDPYHKYYNLFLNYSVFNYYDNFENVDLLKTTAVLNLDSTLVSDKKFIADLPRYSALSRLLFAFPQKSSFPDTFTFDIYIAFKDGAVKSDTSSIKKFSFTGRDNSYPVYSFLSSYSADTSYFYSEFNFNDKELFHSIKNPYVYKLADIVGFSFRKAERDSWFVVKIIFSKDKKDRELLICSDTSAYKNLPKNSLSEGIVLTLDGYISANYIDFKKMDFQEMYESDILISNPYYLSLSDTLFKCFDFNIKKLLKVVGKQELDSITDIIFYARNSDIADVSFSYDNAYSLSAMKSIVDRILTYKNKNIWGFYTADEVERSEVYNHDRWMHSYAVKIYPSNRILKKDKNTVKFLQNEIRKYIKSKGKTPFTLSTIHFYTEKGGMISDYDSSFSISTDSFIFYDDYSYTNSFVNNFLKLEKLSDSLSLKILYVGDAYSAPSKQSLSFNKMKWRFFTPLIMGADGMLFFSYSSRKVSSFSQLLADTNKMNIGYFSKFIYENGIIDCLPDAESFVIPTGKYLDRISSVFSDSVGNIFIMYFGRNLNTPLREDGNFRNMLFNEEDDDIREIKKLMKNNNCFVSDITPYLDESLNIISDESVRSFYGAESCDSSDICKILNSNSFNLLVSDYDVKIINISTADVSKFNTVYSKDTIFITITDPQVLSEASLSISYLDSNLKLVRNNLIYSSKGAQNKWIRYSNKIPLKSGINSSSDLVIKYINVWGERKSERVHI